MNSPYWNGGTGYADDGETDADDRGGRRYGRRSATTALYDDAPEYQPEYTRNLGYDDDTQDLGEPMDYEDYDDFDDGHPGYYGADNRWRWVAAIAGVVLLIALVGTAVALRGGDASTAATTPTASSPVQDAVTTTPRTVTATVSPRTPAAPVPQQSLPPETVVTVPPNPSDHQNPQDIPVPPPAAAVDPAVAARTITYSVTGDRQLFDLVTVIYTDAQGFPRTDINVALPWTRTVVLNPGVTLKSVTATSVAGQLNCAITDGAGSMLAQQNAGTILAACSG